jgi:hypothetical protein
VWAAHLSWAVQLLSSDTQRRRHAHLADCVPVLLALLTQLGPRGAGDAADADYGHAHATEVGGAHRCKCGES